MFLILVPGFNSGPHATTPERRRSSGFLRYSFYHIDIKVSPDDAAKNKSPLRNTGAGFFMEKAVLK